MENEIRKIEIEVDKYFYGQELFKLPINYGLWLFLFAYEEICRASFLDPKIVHKVADDYKFALQWAFIGLFTMGEEREGFQKPKTIKKDVIKKATSVLNLSNYYALIFTAYVSYSRGWAKGKLINEHTVEIKRGVEEAKYDAFEKISIRKLHKKKTNELMLEMYKEDTVRKIFENIGKSVQIVSQYEIKYDVSPSEIKAIGEFLSSFIEGMYVFPDTWEINSVNIQYFRKVWILLKSYALANSGAHFEAEKRFQDYRLFTSKIILTSKDNLCKLFAESDPSLSYENIKFTLDLMTLDNKIEILKRDPSLQPLIPLGNDVIALCPALIDSLHMERNMMTLLSRHYKDDYDKTTNILEDNMIDEISEAIKCQTSFLIATRKTIPRNPELGDIDLAILDRKQSALLIAELKWTIDPAETSEIIEKIEKVEQKGKKQVIKKLEYAGKNQEDIVEACFPGQKIENLKIYGTVIIRGFHGTAQEWDPNVPIVEEKTFCERLISDQDIIKTIKWIKNQEFLPQAEDDLKPHSFKLKMGKYTVIWEGYALNEKYL